MHPMWHLDKPQLDSGPDHGSFAGWIAAQGPIHGVALAPEFQQLAPCISLNTLQRPDVPAALGMPGLNVIGFEGALQDKSPADLDHFCLVFEQAARQYEIVIPTGKWRPHDRIHRAEKLQRLEPLLQCPQCRGELNFEPTKVTCKSCGVDFERNGRFDFLSQATRDDYQLGHTDAVSENAYDGEIVNIINRHHRGWVLDCGAGRRDRYYDNVINFEIVDYDSTDVMGLAERLPFKNAVFDAVLSCAVLEHVRDPFACAREILRVLKPGGTLYCQVPFLQPFHGYPEHYYNMTSQGLRNLFGDAIEISHLAPLNFGQPVAALSWILGAYSAGLPESTRQSFLDMSVRDLVDTDNAALLADHVLALSPEAQEQLACCNLLIGSKR
jgi:SAM-dependent methyltransferase